MPLHVFFIKTPLELFAAEAIARQLADGEPRGLVIYDEALKPLLGSGIWTFTEEHFAKRYSSRQRIARLAAFNQHLIQRCNEYLKNKEMIRLYLPRLKNNQSNYFVSRVLQEYGQDRVRIAITPHGLADATNARVSWSKYLVMLSKRFSPLRRLVYGLRYFAFRGDVQGRDHKLVDKVYYLPGIVLDKDIPAEKIALNIINEKSGIQPEGILILGQTLIHSNMISKEDAARVSQQIQDFIAASGIEGPVDFLPHPKSQGFNEFYKEQYHLLENSSGMEALLARRPYRMVISHCSSGLFTARMILGEDVRLVSIGFNLATLPEDITRSTLEIFKQYNVEIIDS